MFSPPSLDKTNPYIAGNPVGGGAAFVGRTSMGRKVRAVLSSPAENALVLYGQRRIGKTSVLEELKARLPHEGPYRPVLFDLQDKAALPLAQVVQELALRLAHELALPMPPAWGDDAPRAFRESFLPQVLNHLTDGSVLVLLFDEFDVLDSPGEAQAGAAFFPYLRDLLALDTRRLKFLFVIGRRPEELSNLAQSVFKSIGLHHVSLLPPDEATELVRLSERNDTLRWTEEAVARVLGLAGGHPLLTQQLCSLVWGYAYQDDPDEPPTIGLAEVDAAVPHTLDSATNALEWLWSGLQPAQRVVASALAGAGPVAISEEQLEQRLVEGGVRIFMRELRDAPRVLQDWALLEPVAAGYRFRVELLRRWIAERKPLARAQEEVDRILPRAENLYQAALGDYRANELKQASDLLRRALALNPHHLRANELLADILIEQGNLAEARTLLEKLYEEQPAAARPRLVQVLLSLAEGTEEVERLALLTNVLQLEYTNLKAATGYRDIWEQRGVRSEQAGQLEKALYAYQKAGLTDEAHKIEILIERKKQLSETYEQALEAWERGDKAAAQRGFAEVVSLEPSYGEATRYLYWATTGVDPNGPSRRTKEERKTQVPSSTSRRLNAGNPFDHLRLLWWFCMTPEHLVAHREQFGDEAEWGTSVWLVSTLCWLPLFIPTFAFSIGRLPFRDGGIWERPDYLQLSGLSWVVWFLMGSFGQLGGRENRGARLLWGVGVGGCLGGSLSVGAGGSIAVGVILGILIGAELSVALGVALGIGGRMTDEVTKGIMLGIVGGVILVGTSGVLLNQAGFLAFGIAGGIGIIGAVMMSKALAQCKATGLTRSLFFILVASYGFLIWFSFFGGWRLFSAS